MGPDKFGRFVRALGLSAVLGAQGGIPAADARGVFESPPKHESRLARKQRERGEPREKIELYRNNQRTFKERLKKLQDDRIHDPERWNALTNTMLNGRDKAALQSAIELVKRLTFNMKSMSHDLDTNATPPYEELYGRYGFQINLANDNFLRFYAFSRDVQDAALADLIQREGK